MEKEEKEKKVEKKSPKSNQSMEISKEIIDGVEHIYVNCNLYNFYDPDNPSSSGAQLAKFFQTRDQPILDCPKNYVMAIERFSIPGSGFPIMLWAGDTYFSVTLVYSGVKFKSNVVIVPQSNDILPAENNGLQIWYYLQMVGMINTALSSSFLALKTAYPAISSTEAPYLIFDAPSQLFSLLAQQTYVSDGIDVYFNFPLSQLFDSWNSYLEFPLPGDGADVKIYIQDQKNNTNTTNPSIPTGYYAMQQPYSTLFAWNSIKNISFLSGMPVRQEGVANVDFTNDNSSNKSRVILTDFDPLNDPLSASTFRSYFQYQPSRLRWIDLTSCTPLYVIDFTIQISDIAGNYHSFYFDENNNISVKMVFKSKKGSIGVI